jgi:hypothetical protein
MNHPIFNKESGNNVANDRINEKNIPMNVNPFF